METSRDHDIVKAFGCPLALLVVALGVLSSNQVDAAAPVIERVILTGVYSNGDTAAVLLK
jgi:hypothetical protein